MSPAWPIIGAVCVIAALIGASVAAARTGARYRLWTILGVALSTVLMVVTIGLASNVKMGWVTDAESLVSMFRGDGGLHRPIKKLPSVEPGELLPDALAPSDEPQWHLHLQPASSENTVTTRWAGPKSAVNTTIEIWTPPDYAPDDGKEYGVVEFLHGFPGSPTGVVDALELNDTYNALVKSGKVRPFIVVIPDLMTRAGEPDCLDFTARPAVETWVTEDVPRAIRSTFPNVSAERGRWLLSGISSGAYCAANLMTRHLDTYGAAAALSGYNQPILGNLATSTVDVKAENTISNLVRGLSHAARLYVGGTATDEDSLTVINEVKRDHPTNLDLATSIDPHGGHTWTTWARQLPSVLQWWDRGETQPEKEAAASASPPAPVSDPNGGVLPNRISATLQLPVGSDVPLLSFRGAGTLVIAWLIGVGLACAASLRRWRFPIALMFSTASVFVLVAATLLTMNANDIFFASLADFQAGWRAFFP